MYPGREESDVSSFGASNNMTWSLVPPANISALAISQTVWPKIKKKITIEIWILEFGGGGAETYWRYPGARDRERCTVRVWEDMCVLRRADRHCARRRESLVKRSVA